MKILEFSQNANNTIVLKVLVGEPEFRHLRGFTDQICMFAIQTIDEPAKATKTGARHSFAKWLLLPAKLRAKFETEEYDYSEVRAGFVEYKDSVFFIYRVSKTGLSATFGQEKEGYEDPTKS